ncbi:ERVV2 protein, partial [Pycnonotus jocosus]|nr:ERVV2 protein [Pycnonotus jocosus]
TGLPSFVRALFPTLGIVHLEKAILNISAEMKIIANSMADTIGWLQTNYSLKEVVFQNHMVLDMITAQMGGVCTLINTSCCAYMAAQSGQITVDIH